jgi:2-polyprenyl-3-methyl-5-hydroxy-6-metoxy-1,4-benzoquinol methylase
VKENNIVLSPCISGFFGKHINQKESSMRMLAIIHQCFRICLFAFLILFGAVLFIFPASSEQAGQNICRDYTEWAARTHPTGESDPIEEYRKELISRGMSSADAGRRIGALGLSMLQLQCSEASRLYFDKTYHAKTPDFNPEPNAFLVEMARIMKPGRALDVAMGQGRNAIYLAINGWDVTGFDVSENGLAIARKAADQAGVKINIVRQGWEEFEFGNEKWDLIVLSYAWVPTNDSAFVKKMCDSLRPGGSIILEQLFMFGRKANEELKAIQNHLRILRYEEVDAEGDWGGPANKMLIRMIARRDR